MKKKDHITSIRLADDLKQWLKKLSGKSCRSLSSEISFILRRAKEESKSQ